MSVFVFMPAQFSEWSWLFGFALGSLVLVALAVLADAFYEGYREHIRDAGRRSAKPETQDAQPARSRAEESSQEKRRAA